MANITLTNPNNPGVLIVGAGLGGLTLARQLVKVGQTVTVFEKSRGVGGRLASRRGGGKVWDHGILSLSPESIPPETYLEWNSFKVLVVKKDQKKLEWICPEGMTQLPKALESGITVCRDTKIESIRIGPGGTVWMLCDHLGQWHYGKTLVLATPAPQALALLEGSFPHQMVTLKDRLSQIRYRPTLTVLAQINRKKYRQCNLKPESPVEQVVDNGEKGVLDSDGALTIHFNEKYSVKNFDQPEDKILTEIVGWAKKKWGVELLHPTLKRWRYSQVTHGVEESYLTANVTSPLYVIGDGFAGGGIKGTLLSANALADHLIAGEKEGNSWRKHEKAVGNVKRPGFGIR